MKIIVDYHDLNKKGDNLIENSEKLKMYLGKMANQIEGFERSWTGKDSETFESTMTENHINSLQKLQHVILAYGNYLKDTAKVYEDLDEIFFNKKIKN